MSECDKFPQGSRLRAICDGTADLPLWKINAYRDRWGLDPFYGPDPQPLEKPGAPNQTERVRGNKKSDCIHRGRFIRRIFVPDCTDRPLVYTCAIYGECTLIRDGGKRQKAIDADGVKVCRGCEDKTNVQQNISSPSAK